MKQKTIGIRELKEQLSSHIKEVKGGATVVVTERGKPVARLEPVATRADDGFQKLIDSGLVEGDGESLLPEIPRGPIEGPKTVAELLLEDRE
jgi:prevent-host-death family protein